MPRVLKGPLYSVAKHAYFGMNMYMDKLLSCIIFSLGTRHSEVHYIEIYKAAIVYIMQILRTAFFPKGGKNPVVMQALTYRGMNK